MIGFPPRSGWFRWREALRPRLAAGSAVSQAIQYRTGVRIPPAPPAMTIIMMMTSGVKGRQLGIMGMAIMVGALPVSMAGPCRPACRQLSQALRLISLELVATRASCPLLPPSPSKLAMPREFTCSCNVMGPPA